MDEMLYIVRWWDGVGEHAARVKGDKNGAMTLVIALRTVTGVKTAVLYESDDSLALPRILPM